MLILFAADLPPLGSDFEVGMLTYDPGVKLSTASVGVDH
jgi:hypothetical protein